MLIPGLVSVTFRECEPRQIIAEVQTAGLHAIEWGGDVHAPPGDAAQAELVQRMSTDAGLKVAAYGSYFRLGREMEVEPWLETARLLGAPTMRIWTGARGSAETTEAQRRALVTELRSVCDHAARYGLTISLEFHEGTFTDRAESVAMLMQETIHDALRTYWQPVNRKADITELKSSIAAVLPWLTHVHVFHRCFDPMQWLALADGRMQWRALFQMLSASKENHAVMIEFVRGNSIAAFREDAAELLALVRESGQPVTLSKAPL